MGASSSSKTKTNSGGEKENKVVAAAAGDQSAARYVRSGTAPQAQCLALAAANEAEVAEPGGGGREAHLIRKSFGTPTEETDMVQQWTFLANDPFAQITIVRKKDIVFSILFPASSALDQKRIGAVLNVSQAYRYDRALQRLMVTCNAGFANVGMLSLAARIMAGDYDAQLLQLKSDANIVMVRADLLEEYTQDRSRAAEFDRDVVAFVSSKRAEWTRLLGTSEQQAVQLTKFRNAVDTF